MGMVIEVRMKVGKDNKEERVSVLWLLLCCSCFALISMFQTEKGGQECHWFEK